jgi:NTP pyrophosphatase (non-canonical NTP hydrolase)
MSLPINYSLFVSRLVKSGQDILDSLTPEKCNQWHLASGISGEAGELSDAFKKYIVYNKPLDRENVIEELGDIEFFVEAIRQSIGVTREEVLDANYQKLCVRYNKGYSDEAAQIRADKLS